MQVPHLEAKALHLVVGLNTLAAAYTTITALLVRPTIGLMAAIPRSVD